VARRSDRHTETETDVLIVLTLRTAEQRTIIRQYDDWYTGRWWVGCYIWSARRWLGGLCPRPVPSTM